MNYLLLGGGKTSLECLKTLIKRKKKVSICLQKEELIKIKEYYSLIEDVYVFNNFYDIDFNKYDFIVRSPGLSILNPYIKYLKENNIKLVNEMELAYLLTNKKGYYIGVTGSNGKTTTVSLLYECIKKQTNNVILAGNIGIPLISLIDKINNYTIIILEMSSFQLEDMHELKFDIACILNLSVNHLDNVLNLDYYYKSKFNITNLQTSNDYLIIDSNDTLINQYLNSKLKAKIINYQKIELNFNDYKLKGEHNLKNIKAVATILKILGFNLDYQIIKKFEPLQYHLQEKQYSNHLIVNDSKSTTVESLKSAINTYKDRNIILIFGGKNKGGNFLFLNDITLKKKICFGSLSKEITDLYLDYKCYDLEEAVQYACNYMEKDDVLLFSCGCSSFDLFDNYKQRGEVFNRLVSKYINEISN